MAINLITAARIILQTALEDHTVHSDLIPFSLYSFSSLRLCTAESKTTGVLRAFGLLVVIVVKSVLNPTSNQDRTCLIYVFIGMTLP